ncbi:MAG: manganese efflux pump [Clostridia bacterium]|nr:manganese efflux pump [Clostridia bacterium]
MQLWEILMIAVGLAMDAFAVSICKGLSVRKLRFSHALICGLYFGGFQVLMPFVGYFVVSRFDIPKSDIELVTGIISFILLALIGGNMIREAFGDEEKVDDCFTPRAMLPLAVATSIDALAVGVTFALQDDVNIVLALAVIGVVTLVISAFGVWIGKLFGTAYRSKAEFLGGTILILMGLKILLEHVGVLG